MTAPAEDRATSSSLIDAWMDRERRYRNGRYSGTGTPNELTAIGGSTGVLFTAPHAVAHIRSQSRKRADRFTGSLAEIVAEATGSSALVLAGSGPGDANWDEEHPFKNALQDTLSRHNVVLDLHGMRDAYGFDICIGRGRLPDGAWSRAAVEAVTECCRSAGLAVSIDRPFNARRPHTITSFVQATGKGAVQVEIAARCRNPSEEPLRASELLEALLATARMLPR